MLLLTIIGQLLICLIALAALKKDWNSYKAISRLGRLLPITLALTITTVTFLTVWQTYIALEHESENIGRIIELRNQLNGLNQKFTDLQSRVNTDPILRQNTALLKEIQDTRKQVIEAKASIEQTPERAELVPTFGDREEHTNLKDISAIRQADNTVECIINVYNNSEVQAKNGSIYLRICEQCSYAEEPKRFYKAVSAIESDRVMNFQKIDAHTAVGIPLKIKYPSVFTKFDVDVTVRCENCMVNPLTKLTVTLGQ